MRCSFAIEAALEDDALDLVLRGAPLVDGPFTRPFSASRCAESSAAHAMIFAWTCCLRPPRFSQMPLSGSRQRFMTIVGERCMRACCSSRLSVSPRSVYSSIAPSTSP